MFNAPVIDLVILLSFTYFTGSLMLSAINESLAAGFSIRAKDLKKTLVNLLLDKGWQTFAEKKLLESQHIKSLMISDDKFPSYIPAQNFVLAVIEALNSNGQYSAGGIPAAITASELPDAMKKVLNDLWAKAQGSAAAGQTGTAAFEKELEQFYNNAMDRASGWYKRKTRRIMLAAGFLLAALLNIDTIKITNDALNDKGKLAKTVDKIIESLPRIKDATSIDVSANGQGADNVKAVSFNQVAGAAAGKIDSIKVVYNDIGGYQMGYRTGQFEKEWGFKPGDIMVFLQKLLGLLITAFALQLGSNFWFDVLSKTVNLRAAGRKPEADRPSKDQAA